MGDMVTKPEPRDIEALNVTVQELVGSTQALSRNVVALGHNFDQEVVTRDDQRRTTKRVLAGFAAAMLAFAAGGLYVKNFVDCVNDLNDKRSSTSVDFWIAEHVKVHGQRRGIEQLIAANGDRAAASAGFQVFADATREYDDYSLKRLQALGVKVTEAKDGTETFKKTGASVEHC